jgi:hypothetical protein
MKEWQGWRTQTRLVRSSHDLWLREASLETRNGGSCWPTCVGIRMVPLGGLRREETAVMELAIRNIEVGFLYGTYDRLEEHEGDKFHAVLYILDLYKA